MGINADKDVEVTLSALVYGGEAMGRLEDGRAIFVPFCLPGEHVRVQITEEKRGHVKASLLEILAPSPQRIQARCPHFTACGGCHYQHIPYDQQLKIKQAILTEQLTRIGGITDPPVRPIIPSPQVWNYRNHIQFHVNAEGKTGFRAAHSNTVIPVDECHLPEQAIDETWHLLELESHPGLERVSFRTGSSGDVLLILESRDDTPPEFSVDIPLSAIHAGSQGTTVLAGNDYITIEILERPFSVSAMSFFQVNTPQVGNMVTHLLNNLPVTPQTRALDIYCGAGLFSAFLAERAGHVTGIEISPSACTDFTVNLEAFDNVDLYQGSAEEILPALASSHLDHQSWDVVVVDPPRSGLERSVLDSILAIRPPRLAYISCDPSTLSRDAKRLIQGGYKLEQVTPFDIFPHTYHIESMSIFTI